MMSANEHCPGCRGYSADYRDVCPGIPVPDEQLAVATGVTVSQQYVPRLSWRARLDALLGKPVLVATHAKMYGAGGGGGFTNSGSATGGPPAPRQPGVGGGGASSGSRGPSEASGGPG